MSYSLQFRPEVPGDVDAACRWYEDRGEGLGRQFLNELQEVLLRISRTPELYAAGERGVRSARIRRFAYVVHYRIEDSAVVVMAVVFGGRDPAGWHERL